MPVIFQHRIYRSDLRLNPSVTYVFGDNVARKGFGGQAAEMRGEPNSIGIVTKWIPTMRDEAFFYDHQKERIILLIRSDMEQVNKLISDGKIVVIPSDGLGSGLSRLNQTAPLILSFIEEWLNDLRMMTAFYSTHTKG